MKYFDKLNNKSIKAANRRQLVRVAILSACFLMLMTYSPLYAWFPAGHEVITKIAVQASQQSLPAYFVDGMPLIVHCSADPDLFKITVNDRELAGTEGPEHYIDLELLDGTTLPATREEFSALCYKKHLNTYKVGTVPYAVAEWAERLTIAFAEHRCWPENKAIQIKCCVYAGILSHYAEDLCMPLHTTIHHDGRALANGASPKTGIHQKVDALPEKLAGINELRIESARIVPFDNLQMAISDQLEKSHADVNSIYSLEKSLPDVNSPIQAGTNVERFARQWTENAAVFSGRLYATAWHDSASIKMPKWHHRPAQEEIIISDEKTQPRQTSAKHGN